MAHVQSLLGLDSRETNGMGSASLESSAAMHRGSLIARIDLRRTIRRDRRPVSAVGVQLSSREAESVLRLGRDSYLRLGRDSGASRNPDCVDGRRPWCRPDARLAVDPLGGAIERLGEPVPVVVRRHHACSSYRLLLSADWIPLPSPRCELMRRSQRCRWTCELLILRRRSRFDSCSRWCVGLLVDSRDLRVWP
jgi:hypothetical protein